MQSFLDMTFAEFVTMLQNLKNSDTIHDCTYPNDPAFKKGHYSLCCQFYLKGKDGKDIHFVSFVHDYVSNHDFSHDAKKGESDNIFLDVKINNTLYFNIKITNFFGKEDERQYIVNGVQFSPIDNVSEAMVESIKTNTQKRIWEINTAEFHNLKIMDEVMGNSRLPA